MPETPPALTDAELAGREWPALRASIIDIAAALDRLDATGASESARVRAEAEALLRTLLEAGDADRAERLLEQLSRQYDPAWRERFAADNPDESL